MKGIEKIIEKYDLTDNKRASRSKILVIVLIVVSVLVIAESALFTYYFAQYLPLHAIMLWLLAAALCAADVFGIIILKKLSITEGKDETQV